MCRAALMVRCWSIRTSVPMRHRQPRGNFHRPSGGGPIEAPAAGRRTVTLMRICKIWDADYPWDIRVEKVATSLSEAGHDVHLVFRNEARKPTLEWDGRF